MGDLIAVLFFLLVVVGFALAIRRRRIFGLKPWEGPHDKDTWLPDFILDRLD